MRWSFPLALSCVLLTGAVGCGATDGGGSGVGQPADPGRPVATVGDLRFSLPTKHQVVAERRTTDGWGDPRVVFEDRGRECGMVHAAGVDSTVAATVLCDRHFAEDQAPTGSVALISTDGRSWDHRDLDGEASSTPSLSPDGRRVVWVQDGDLLTWVDGSFSTAPGPTWPAQLITIDDSGAILGFGAGKSAGQCTVAVRTSLGGPTQPTIRVAKASELLCVEVGLWSITPSEVHGDVSGQPGTEFVLGRTSTGDWALDASPPLAAPGLDVYPADARRAIWNQVTANTGGDLVAVGSPDRQHLTAQRYDPTRQRWTPSRVVHVSDGPTCRRAVGDSGVLQGATFRLRLICGGDPVVLRSRTGATWTSSS